jgi:hypothetical protein
METVHSALVTLTSSFLRRNNFLPIAMTAQQPSVSAAETLPQNFIEAEQHSVSSEEDLPRDANFIDLNLGYSRVRKVKTRPAPKNEEPPVWIRTILTVSVV